MGAREPARREPAARALSPTPPLRRCGLYKTCEPKKCGKKWRQNLKPSVYEIERPAGAPCTLENLENIKNLKRDQLPIDCKGKELKTDKKVVLPDMSGDKVDFSSAKLEAAKGIEIQKAIEGKFEAASLFTDGRNAHVRRAARLPAP